MDEEEDVAVEFEVPFRAVEVREAPWSSVWEFDEEDRVMVPFVILLAIVLKPKMVVDPKVVVLVERSVVIVETMADVVSAEEDMVIVEVSDR